VKHPLFTTPDHSGEYAVSSANGTTGTIGRKWLQPNLYAIIVPGINAGSMQPLTAERAERNFPLAVCGHMVAIRVCTINAHSFPGAPMNWS
jgi:hypothetical protein